jgi:hypothetical protein
MNKGLKFASWLVALILGAAAALPLEAQNRPPKNQPHPHQEQKQQQHQQQRNERKDNNSNRSPDLDHSGATNPNRPPVPNPNVAPNMNRPPERARNQQNANRPPIPSRTITPEERRRNEQQFSRLSPQQKQDMRDREKIWQKMTPTQRDHVKNDVMPKWQQLPPDRQRAIRSRLNVLQNMPESARNQHLADPNFTRGMSEEDKAMLQDLSHLHVGGAPDEPHE